MQASSVVPQTQRSIERDRIAAVERLIRPYVRHTPTITVDAQDFGLDAAPLVMKLEFLQHTGSFKPRGAFANLLTRPAPPAGVAAASGLLLSIEPRHPSAGDVSSMLAQE
jgi:threonine dehydratase